MSIPKPRRFTYYERVKSTYEMVNDTESKSLCTNLLKFVEECVGDSKSTALDFTDKKSEENISQFLAKNEAFFGTVFESFCKFHAKGLFDLLSRDGAGKKDLNKSRILIGHIEKNCYQILCLCALYSPSTLQQRFVTELSAFLAKSQLETPLGLTEITAWTALLLLINPIKLKYQCDGSIEVFTHFNKVLQQGPPSMQNNSLPSSTQFPSSSLASRSPLPSGSSSLKKDWANPCLKGTIQLALGVSIKFARNSLGLGIPHELDECIFVDEGIKKMALEFLQACLVQVPAFCDLAFSVDVLDSILKNFICYFPDKLVEMYNLCEEELYSLLDWQNSKSTAMMDAPTAMELEGGVPSQNQTNFDNMHFKTLLELIAALYEPENPQLTKLSMEFTDPNFEALCDFVQRGRAISTPALQIAYLSMLKSLCKSPQSAEMFFNIFR